MTTRGSPASISTPIKSPAMNFTSAPSTPLRSAQDEAAELLNVVFGKYRPNQVVAWKEAGAESAIPLLEGREAIEGKATA